MKRIFIVLFIPFFMTWDDSCSQGTLYFDNSVRVYDNNVMLQDPWAGGINSGQFGRIDFTGDGVKDLVVYDRSSDMLNLFRYDSGRYEFAPQYNYLFPGDLYGFVVIRDYDHDGQPDIFTSGKQGLKAYRNISAKGELPSFKVASDPVFTHTSSGRINLQVNYTDIPSIDDIDGDGDLDILVYNFALGKSIRYHKNLSMEKYGNDDSLDFELVDQEWGQFQECECNLFAFTTKGESCENIVNQRSMHIGGKSLLLIDMDGDGDKDLVLGHDLCSELYFLPNTGTKDLARMTSYSAYFPDTANRAYFPLFPAGYSDDFDNDGIKDLVVSPNDEYNIFRNIDYKNSVWFYKNTAEDDSPSFQLVSKNLLQQNMIDIGENAKPLLTDIDQDGKIDLLIAGNGYLYNGKYYGYVKYFRNTGTPYSPVFMLVDDDFLALSSLRLTDLFISASDFNHDGTGDLFVCGTVPGNESISSRIYYLSASDQPGMDFAVIRSESVDLPIEINDTPAFTDVNNDGRVDMLLGKQTGRLDYYENVGSLDLPVFILKENDFLGIHDSFVEFRKNLVPALVDIDLDGNEDLITSDRTGDLFIYRNFRNETKKEQVRFYNLLLDMDEIRKQGYHTWIAAGTIIKGSYPVLILGNKQGGVTLYRQDLTGNADDENHLVLNLFPNPAKNNLPLNIKVNQSGKAMIFNNMGQPVSSQIPVTANRVKSIDLVHLPQGLYIIRMKDLAGRTSSARFIINR